MSRRATEPSGVEGRAPGREPGSRGLHSTAARDASDMGHRRTYYTLVERDGGEHPWRIEFGDFDRATVAAEHQDRRDHGVRSADQKILTSGPQAVDQKAAVGALNARRRTLIIVTWRDEAYGSLGGISSAFRLYDTVDLSDAARRASTCTTGAAAGSATTPARPRPSPLA